MTLSQPSTARTGAAAGAQAEMNGTRKAAVLLISLGTETAAKVLRCLGDEEVEKISIEIARFRNVSTEVVEGVLREFRERSTAAGHRAQGGVTFAREALQSALDPQRAAAVMMKVEAAAGEGMQLLQQMETNQLINFLRHEHPQTTALILAHLSPEKSADILIALPGDLQHEVVYRLATMGKTSPELLRDVEEVIRQQLGTVFGTNLNPTGGIDRAADLLKNLNRTTEKSILEALHHRDARLASSIKNLMFIFDDLIHLSDRDVQRILMEIENNDLILALKGASEELKAKLLGNISDRAAQQIREEMDLLGPVRVSEVNEAQRRILDTAQGILEDEVGLGRGHDEVIL